MMLSMAEVAEHGGSRHACQEENKGADKPDNQRIPEGVDELGRLHVEAEQEQQEDNTELGDGTDELRVVHKRHT